MSSTSSSPPARKMQDRPPSTVTGQGLARNPSIRSRPIRKTPLRSSISGESGVPDDDAMAANTQMIAELKQQVERAEQASETYRRQLDAMQKQLDEASNLTTAAEEREFQFRTQIDTLQAQLRDSVRHNRELELSYDSERNLLMQDKERHSTREAELHTVVNRLTENLRFKNQELASTNKMDSGPEPAQPDDDLFQVLQSKDNAIESLRLELADIHLKMAEQEHMGDGRLQTVENELVDIKMRNIRLQEENESFQMLLSERTLKGDFLQDSSADIKHVSSLAEELESVDDSEISTETYRTVEAENKTLRESNKALTLYIDKIIGRLLQHEGFEHIIKGEAAPPSTSTTNTTTNATTSATTNTTTNTNKALPEPPTSPRKVSAPAPTTEQTGFGASLLQRARSVVARPTPPRPRPVSMMPTANENPETAPSIPIGPKHRRARSDQANDLGAANVIQQMNRGSQLRTSGGPISPGLSPMSPMSAPKQSYFSPPPKNTTSPSQRPDSSSNSMVSEHSLEGAGSTDASSARASVMSNNPTVPGAVMKQNQLRPLRLVQNQVQGEEDKKANRGSWMGWFNKGVDAQQA